MKRVLAVTAVVLGASAAPAQADVFDPAFGRLGFASAPLEAGTGNGDHLNVVVNAPGGGYYAAGYVIKGANSNQQMALAKLTPSGQLDGTFGTGGVAVVDQSPAANNVEQARGIAVQSDGKIVIGGLAGATATDSEVYVSRFTSGGVIDGTFGVGGTRKVELSAGGDQAWGLIRRPDDRLVVVASRGQEDGAIPRVDRDYGFIGLTANGDLDPTWGTGGVKYPPRATTVINGVTYELNENPRGGTIQTDGKILTAGYGSGSGAAAAFTRPYIYRLLADGTPDPTWGTNGLASYDLNGPMPNTSESYMLAQQSDGKVISVGYGNTGTPANINLLVTRLTTDGRLDTSFGTNGVFSYDAGFADRARNVVVTPDDKILVVGSTEISTGPSVTNGILLKLTKDGKLESTFGSGGVVAADFGGATDALFGLTLTPDRKQAVAVGWGGPTAASDDSLALRLNFVDPPAPEVITKTVTNTVETVRTVTVPGTVNVTKPAGPRASTTIKRSARRLTGTVASPANVSKVLVRLTRGTGSKCRAYAPKAGTFSGRSCTSGKGFAVAYADGKWTLELAKKLTKGSYKVEVLAYALDGVAQSTPSKASFRV